MLLLDKRGLAEVGRGFLVVKELKQGEQITDQFLLSHNNEMDVGSVCLLLPAVSKTSENRDQSLVMLLIGCLLSDSLCMCLYAQLKTNARSSAFVV